MRASEFVSTQSRLPFLEPNFWTTRWGCVYTQHPKTRRGWKARPVDLKFELSRAQRSLPQIKLIEFSCLDIPGKPKAGNELNSKEWELDGRFSTKSPHR